MSFSDIIKNFLTGIVSPTVTLLVGVAIALFLLGLVNYLRAGLGDKAQLDKAKSMMFWGVVVIAVMVSVWGLVEVLQGIFFGDSVPTTAPNVPCFQGENCPSGSEGSSYSGPEVFDI